MVEAREAPRLADRGDDRQQRPLPAPRLPRPGEGRRRRSEGEGVGGEPGEAGEGPEVHLLRPLRAAGSPVEDRPPAGGEELAVGVGGGIEPRGLERDIIAGKRPQIVILHNKQYFTPGNIASGALTAAVSNATADLPAAPSGPAGYAPGPLVVEQYVLTNPALNYAQFLLRAILPTVLHIVIAIAAGYAVGSEFGARDMRSACRRAFKEASKASVQASKVQASSVQASKVECPR